MIVREVMRPGVAPEMVALGWPGDGVHWTWQRCGRYEYQKVLMHSTNPDHLVPSTPSLTDIPPLQVAPRYRRDDGFTMNRLPR